MSQWVCCLLLQQGLHVFVSFSCRACRQLFCLWCLCFCCPSIGLSFGLWERLGLMCHFPCFGAERARRVPLVGMIYCFTMFSTSFWAATSALASFGHGPTMATHLSSLCSLNTANLLNIPLHHGHQWVIFCRTSQNDRKVKSK